MCSLLLHILDKPKNAFVLRFFIGSTHLGMSPHLLTRLKIFFIKWMYKPSSAFVEIFPFGIFSIASLFPPYILGSSHLMHVSTSPAIFSQRPIIFFMKWMFIYIGTYLFFTCLFISLFFPEKEKNFNTKDKEMAQTLYIPKGIRQSYSCY